ncbi:uncharacterized protein LOC108032057 [Drosophila biarmipes]|uniref:uncharacterized protein LOC108032057 n=1 Tax=Drosophila biarmipes TaxID=125945 RepID=UPI0021CCBD35|nr:uncharacterized protein LOC108032057 [Drosophila biarmipes]
MNGRPMMEVLKLQIKTLLIENQQISSARTHRRLAAKYSRANMDQEKHIDSLPPEPNEWDSWTPCDLEKPSGEPPGETQGVAPQDPLDPGPRDQGRSPMALTEASPAKNPFHMEMDPEKPQDEPVDLSHQKAQDPQLCHEEKHNVALGDTSPAYLLFQMKAKDLSHRDPQNPRPCDLHKPHMALTEASPAYLQTQMDAVNSRNEFVDILPKDPQNHQLYDKEKPNMGLGKTSPAYSQSQVDAVKPKDEPVDRAHQKAEDSKPSNQQEGLTKTFPAIPLYKIPPEKPTDQPIDLSPPKPQANKHFQMVPVRTEDPSNQVTPPLGLAKASSSNTQFQLVPENLQDEPLDLSPKNRQAPDKPQDEPLDLSHSKRNNKEPFKMPYLATRNFKSLGPPPEPHVFSMSTSKLAFLASRKACAEEKPISQRVSNDLGDQKTASLHANHLNSQDGNVLPITTTNLHYKASWQAFADEKPFSQPNTDDDLLSDPGFSSSHSRQEGEEMKMGFPCLRQLDGPPRKEQEPKESQSSWTTDHIPDSKKDYMQQWLLAVTEASFSQAQKPKESEAEVLPLMAIPDSDDEELPNGTNPFARDIENAQEAPQLEVLSPQQAEERMDDYLQRLRFRVAIPESCLTDDIFRVDRPRDAVVLGKDLPPLRLLDNCKEKDYIVISVCKVYSPFQFWFHFVNQTHDTELLAAMTRDMNAFYNHQQDAKYSIPVSRYYLKAGYICAANHRTGWRRARILITPPKDADRVSIYYVDYASAAEVSPNDLKFLPEWFAETPALAFRGTLSHIHPLDIHWPPDSTQQFRRLVFRRHVHAHVVELDVEEGILFMQLSQNKEFDPSINRKLVDAKLAGESQNYSQRLIDFNCGRRLRYLRERLPSFPILEARLIPLKDEEFEIEFDDIIYSPSFYEDYKLPELANPFRSGLLEALAAWMPAYRRDQEHWCEIYKKADQKLRAKALERQKTALERYDKMMAEREAEERREMQEKLRNPKKKREFMLSLQLRDEEDIKVGKQGEQDEEKNPGDHVEENNRELQTEEKEPEGQNDDETPRERGEVESKEEAGQKHTGLKVVVESKEQIDQKVLKDDKKDTQSNEGVDPEDSERNKENEEGVDSRDEVGQRDAEEQMEEIQPIHLEEKKNNQEEVDQRDPEEKEDEVDQAEPIKPDQMDELSKDMEQLQIKDAFRSSLSSID